MSGIKDLISGEILLFDGAMGTVLQEQGLKPGEAPEFLNIKNPEIITEIHRSYVAAGADIITANTFQAHELKIKDRKDLRDIIRAGIACAKNAGAKFTALDVGPLGQLMEPMGVIGFERAYEIFKKQMVLGEEAGADLIIIETVSDPYEAKAAILAAKENTGLPVICCMTFQEDGRTFTGCDPLTATAVLQGLGVDALGVNCSLGIKNLLPTVDIILKYSHIPVIVQANAGLPVTSSGELSYVLDAKSYAETAVELVRRGVRIIGGCCGTTPEYIKEIKHGLKGVKPQKINPERVTVCTSGTCAVILDNNVTVIGERLNPTGKKRMKEAVKSGDMGYIAGEAISQIEAGAQLLDVNAGLPDIDEPETLKKIVKSVQSVTDAPLMIDSANPLAVEAAVRVYNGIPVINSVNGKEESLKAILPIAEKYGALVVGLTLDENGIPETAQKRLFVARRIAERALSHKIPKNNLLIDCLVLTASAQQSQVKETIEAVKLVKSEGFKTVLGISNVSFGLPVRESLNAVFLAATLGAGLDAAIINPLSERSMEAVNSFRVLNGEDKDAEFYIAKYASKPKKDEPPKIPSEPSLKDIIVRGRREQSENAVKKLLKVCSPLEIIENEFIPALNIVGKRFEKGEIFLPRLLMSAQAVQNGFKVIEEKMSAAGEKRQTKGKILLATVHGDIHDIGKNIVKMLLESYGYEVVDLGKDVPKETVVEAIRNHDIRLAGLSALMTTTVKNMKETISFVRESAPGCRIIVGGAVLNEEYAQFVGADFYAKDAMGCVAVADGLFKDGAL